VLSVGGVLCGCHNIKIKGVTSTCSKETAFDHRHQLEGSNKELSRGILSSLSLWALQLLLCIKCSEFGLDY